MRASEFISNSLTENKLIKLNVPVVVSLPDDESHDQDKIAGRIKPVTIQSDNEFEQPTELKSVHIDSEHDDEHDPQELEDKPLMVPPLQQTIELQKSAAGKLSKAVQHILKPDIEQPKVISLFRKQGF